MAKAKLLTHNGITDSLRGWAKRLKTTHTVLRYRLKRLPKEKVLDGVKLKREFRGNRYKRIKHTNAHRFIVEKVLGRSLTEGECVHHVDGDIHNNRNQNLVICPSAKYHALLHQRQRAIDACGNPEWRKCSYCKQYDDPNNLVTYPNQTNYRHKHCAARRKRNAK